MPIGVKERPNFLKEMTQEMELHQLTKAQLVRKLNISIARLTQMLNFLKLPEELLREVEEMGDYWERRLLTERSLRKMRMDH